MEEKVEKTKRGIKVKELALIIVLVIVAIFFIHVIKNWVIVTNIQNRVRECANSTNYYSKKQQIYGDGTTKTLSYYVKDNKKAIIFENSEDGKSSKLSQYNNGSRTDLFIETDSVKRAQIDINNDVLVGDGLDNILYTNDTWERISFIVKTRIKIEEYNGKKCYSFTITGDNDFTQKIYIEKETGLAVKVDVEGEVQEIGEYGFGNVDDSVFVEPDIGQYDIMKD